MKKDLESIFKRLKIIKQKLNKQMPEAYEAVIGASEREAAKEEDDEYDLQIRERKTREAAMASSSRETASEK